MARSGRRRRATPFGQVAERYRSIPVAWHRKLTYGSALAGATTMLGLVLLFGLIMPADLLVLPDGVKVLAAIGVIIGGLMSVVLWGKLFWEIARLVARRFSS